MEELYGLSPSERDILACLAQGMSTEDIAHHRQRALGTVRQQIKSVLHKLGASSQVQAATMAAAAATATALSKESHDGNQLISHEIGVVVALALANRHPEQLTTILAISPTPPFREWHQLEGIPTQQRIFLWAAQRTPWMWLLAKRLSQR